MLEADVQNEIDRDGIGADVYQLQAAGTNLVEEKLSQELEGIRLVLLGHAPELVPTLDNLHQRLVYAHHALGMASEAGEVAGKVKKLIRDRPLTEPLSQEGQIALLDEAGDTAWYLSQLARSMSTRMSTVLKRNLVKLSSRKARGVIGGSGDVR